MISQHRDGGDAMPAHPESQEELLEAALARLTDADLPPDDADWALSDPDCGRPATLAGLSAGELAELIAAERAPVPGPLPAGCLPRDGSGGGSGFADGGPLDVLEAGVTLAGFADEAYARAGDLDDDSLIGVLRAYRRLTSRAQARELAVIAEVARRRPADRTAAAEPGQFPAVLSEFLPDEIAMALTLTQRGAEIQVGLALDLAARPAIGAALEAGRIDLYRARILLEALVPLAAGHAAAVEAAILPAAGGLTAGELRAEVTQAVLALDPGAMRKRRREAEKHARVESWTDPEGTATLAGRNPTPARSCPDPSTAWTSCGPGRTWRCCSAGRSAPRPPASCPPPIPPAHAPRTARTSVTALATTATPTRTGAPAMTTAPPAPTAPAATPATTTAPTRTTRPVRVARSPLGCGARTPSPGRIAVTRPPGCRRSPGRST